MKILTVFRIGIPSLMLSQVIVIITGLYYFTDLTGRMISITLSTALLAVLISSWITVAFSYILSTKKHFITTAEDFCDELINLIISYSHTNENDKELTKQKIFTYRDLCSGIINKNYFDNKEIPAAWEEINSDIGNLICPQKLANELAEELNKVVDKLIKLRVMVTKDIKP